MANTNGREGFNGVPAGGAANMMQLMRSESSSTDSLVAMLASCSPAGLQASRSFGSLEDALVGCGQKRGPFYPGATTAFEASAEEFGDDDAGDDGMSCAHNNNVEKKRRLTFDQVRSLNKNFELENKLEPERKMQLAKELGLQPRQVAVWFQNRRARWKTKQLERDYEVLSLEYNRLKTELDTVIEEKQELQAKVQWLTGKAHDPEAMELSGCEAAAAAAGDGSSKLFVTDSTAPALHPSTSNNDETQTQVNLLGSALESKIVELSNNNRDLNQQPLRSFPTAREELAPSSTARNNRKQLQDGSPPGSVSTSSEILDADSPGTIDSRGFSRTQAVRLDHNNNKTVTDAGGPQAACPDTIRAPDDTRMMDLTEGLYGRVFSPRTGVYAPARASASVKLEPELLLGTSSSAIVFPEQIPLDSCNYLLTQAVTDEHAGALSPWWDWP